MKNLRMLGGPLLAAGVFAAWNVPASAQTYGGGYPVCLQNYHPIQFFECQYTSIPQCQASASGRAATCVVNPFFEGSPPRPERRQRRG